MNFLTFINAFFYTLASAAHVAVASTNDTGSVFLLNVKTPGIFTHDAENAVRAALAEAGLPEDTYLLKTLATNRPVFGAIHCQVRITIKRKALGATLNTNMMEAVAR